MGAVIPPTTLWARENGEATHAQFRSREWHNAPAGSRDQYLRSYLQVSFRSTAKLLKGRWLGQEVNDENFGKPMSGAGF